MRFTWPFFFNTEHDLHNRCHIVSSRWDLNFRSMFHTENVDHSQIVSSTRMASSNSFKSKFNPNQMVPWSQLVRKCCNFAAEIYSDIAESSKMWSLFRYCRDPVETFTQLLKRFSHPLQCLRFTRYLLISWKPIFIPLLQKEQWKESFKSGKLLFINQQNQTCPVTTYKWLTVPNKYQWVQLWTPS